MTDSRISPDVIMRSRVRLARNIVDYPFHPLLNDACRKEIIEKVAAALSRTSYACINNDADRLALPKLFEENYVSKEFANEKEKHALFFDENEKTYIMVCEEDHLRIQAFSDGIDLLNACNKALGTEELLNKSIRFAFDSQLGYLTHCPTNLGTAMRASVMMFLPALTKAKRMGELKSQLEKIGITIRGIYGEGSAADAYIYQISNSLSLGISETDIVNKVEAISKKIAEDELNMRQTLYNANKDQITDKVFRSYGVLKHAHMISSAEFMNCYAEVRLGISLGIIGSIDLSDFDKLLFEAMPAHLIDKNKGAASDAVLRDKLRAETIKQRL